MSSLSATQADGYYVPPEYFESGQYKKKSKNQFAGSNGHNQYLLYGVVRFELPYKGICQGCRKSIGRGTRYNAQKTKTDQSYFTTPIWEFTMTCRTAECQTSFQIRTNPQERGFDFVQGITIQQGQEDQLHGAAAVVQPKSSLERLEQIMTGKRKQMTEHDQLKTLQQLNQVTSLQDADYNATVRTKFRRERKDKRLRLAQGAKKGWREGMELLAPDQKDAARAQQNVFGNSSQREQQKFAKLRKSSIFEPPAKRQGKRDSSRRVVTASPVRSSSNLAAIVPSPIISSSTDIPTNTAQPTGRVKRKINVPQKNEISKQNPPSSLAAMLACYGSDSDGG
jgi:coiled-coil domain-containing protein 130